LRPPSILPIGVAALALWAGVAWGANSASQPFSVDRALFAPGSCVLFPPTAGDTGKTVYLDAGHGGPDPGAIGVTSGGRTIEEATETLAVVQDATVLLRAAGYQVLDSRTTDSSVVRLRPGDVVDGIFTQPGRHANLVARDLCANLGKADILIGVYFNAGAPEDAGSLTLYNDDRPFWRASAQLAELVQSSALISLREHGYDVPDDGVHTDVGYGSLETAADRAYNHLILLGPPKAGYLTTPSEMPGALIEPLFITDPAEGSIANGTAGQQAIARGLVAAVDRYFASAA
jgi:N-acetylmuramoyl-L-alanine amidase